MYILGKRLPPAPHTWALCSYRAAAADGGGYKMWRASPNSRPTPLLAAGCCCCWCVVWGRHTADRTRHKAQPVASQSVRQPANGVRHNAAAPHDNVGKYIDAKPTEHRIDGTMHEHTHHTTKTGHTPTHHACQIQTYRRRRCQHIRINFVFAYGIGICVHCFFTRVCVASMFDGGVIECCC